MLNKFNLFIFYLCFEILSLFSLNAIQIDLLNSDDHQMEVDEEVDHEVNLNSNIKNILNG